VSEVLWDIRSLDPGTGTATEHQTITFEGDTVADRERVGYRFTVKNPEGRFVVEQQAYLSTREGRIDWMRVLCSGFRSA